jgi:hypothetical protein
MPRDCSASQVWLFRVATRLNVRASRWMIVTVVSFGGSTRHVRRFGVSKFHTMWCEKKQHLGE